MKKLLFVMETLNSGGAERSLVNLLTELVRYDYQISLLLFRQEGAFLKQLPDGVTLLETPPELKKLMYPFSKEKKRLNRKTAANLISRLHEKEPLLRRGYRWKNFYSKWIPKLPGHYDTAIAFISGEIMYYVDEKVNADRKIVWVHSDYRMARHPKKYDYEHFEKMDAIVSVSEKCVDILKEEFPKFHHKIFMLPNITSSVAVRRRAEEFRPTEWDEAENKVVSVGRLETVKGFDMAVAAAAMMKQKGIAFRWLIIGDGEKRQELEQQIRAEGVEDVFFLIGTRENPYPYMKHCTVLAQTSRYEGKSVVLDEAKILGVPILATCYPTVADQVLDGKEGIVVEMNPEGIAAGLEMLLKGSEKCEEIRKYLLDREYGNQALVKEYQKLIDSNI